MGQKGIVIGIGFTSRLFLIRALGQAGYDVDLICMGQKHFKPIDAYSRYVNQVYFCENEEEALIDLLLNKYKELTQKSVLFPNNDFTAAALDRHLNELSPFFHLPHIHQQQGAICEWMNKEKQKDLARNLGIKAARSLVVPIQKGEYQIPEGITYPCFTKTREYAPGYKSTLNRCDNEEELRQVFDRLCRYHDHLNIMVEDYMAIEQEYSVVGFSDGCNVVIPGIIKVTSMAEGSVKGVAKKGVVEPTKGNEPLIQKFRDYVKSIGFVGLFDIDYYRSNGEIYFGEMNLRIGGSACAFLRMGVNLPQMMTRHFLSKGFEDLKSEIDRPATYVNERICSENWCEHKISVREFRQLLDSSEISFVKDEKDKLPERIFRLGFIPMTIKWMLFPLKQTAKKILGR